MAEAVIAMPPRRRLTRKTRPGVAGDGSSGALPPIVQRTAPVKRKRRTSVGAARRGLPRRKLKFARSNNMRRMYSRLVYGGPGFTTMNQWDAIQVPRSIPSTDVSAFTIYPSLFRVTFSTSTTLNTYFLFQWGAGGVRGCSWVDQGAATPAQQQPMTGVFWGNNLVNISIPPNMIRPLRQAVRVRNTTKLSDVSGAVRVLNSPLMNQYISAMNLQANNIGWTTAGVTSFKNLVEQNPSVVTHSAATFLRTQRFVIPPASVSGYEQWNNFMFSNASSLNTKEEAENRASVDMQWQAASDSSAMNFLLLQFEPSSTANSYELSYHCIDACRFAANTAFAAMAVMPSKWTSDAQAAAIKNAQTSVKIFGEPDPAPAGGGGAAGSSG